MFILKDLPVHPVSTSLPGGKNRATILLELPNSPVITVILDKGTSTGDGRGFSVLIREVKYENLKRKKPTKKKELKEEFGTMNIQIFLVA